MFNKWFGSGWKTKLGAFVMTVAPLFAMFGHPEHTETAKIVGMAIGTLGVAHKVEKAGFMK